MSRDAQFELSDIVSFVFIYICHHTYLNTLALQLKRDLVSRWYARFSSYFFRVALLLVFISQRVKKILIKHCSAE